MEIGRITLELQRIAAQQGISAEAVDAMHDELLDMVIVRMSKDIAEWRPSTATLDVPTTWWDAWKHEHRRSLLFGEFVKAHPPEMTTHHARLALPDFPVQEFHRQPLMQVAYWNADA